MKSLKKIMANTKRICLMPCALCLVLVLVDQIAKGYILYLLTGSVPAFGRAFNLVPYPYLMARVTNFFNIVFTWNPGTSFSLFRALGEAAPVAIVVITAAIIGFFGHVLLRAPGRLERISLALIIGGAVGNLVDRIRFGAVIDFLDFHYAGYHWPAFNFADIFICIGVALYVFHWIRRRK
ncbi:MAG: signal peptidase II [Alphaproteobacteria bacterium]|nr:signal peptidase II [Alphaproteobacteria bacterium]